MAKKFNVQVSSGGIVIPISKSNKFSLKEPRRPPKPVRPIKPIEPEKTIDVPHDIPFVFNCAQHVAIPLDEILAKLPPGIAPDKLTLCVESSGSDCGGFSDNYDCDPDTWVSQCYLRHFVRGESPSYSRDMKAYNRKLTKFDRDMKKYNEKMVEHDIALKKYEEDFAEFQAKQAILNGATEEFLSKVEKELKKK